jgi:WD40 repeat protein
MTETSALAAVAAAESNIKDAEDDLKRITESKAKNAKSIAAANAAVEASKKMQDKVSADLAAAKLAVTRSTTKALAVSFSADAQRVAAMFDDNVMKVWAVATGTLIDEVAATAPATMKLSTVPDGSFVASKSFTLSTGSSAPHWVLERTLGGISDHSLFVDRVNAVRFSPDGKILATGGGELSRTGDVILFDVGTGRPVKTWKDRHADTVLCLDFSPDGKLLASGAADKIARVTDIASGKQVNLFEGHTHHVMGVAFRSDGRVLATAGADGVVNSWDMFMGERKKKIEGWTKEVTSLQFIGATNQIVTSAGDNRIRIVTDDGTEVRTMAKLPDFMQAAVSAPNGNTVIGGGEDSQLRVWDGTGKELAVFGAH